MADDSNNLAVLLHLVEIVNNAGLSTIVLPALGGLGERLLLRAVPSWKIWGRGGGGRQEGGEREKTGKRRNARNSSAHTA
jgi:hypothetical protein